MPSRAHTKHEVSSSMSNDESSDEWWFEARPQGVARKQPRPTDSICCSTSARWYEAFATSVASSQSIGRSGSSGSEKTQVLSRKSRRPGGDLTVGRQTHHCLRSECRSEGRYCFACFSRDVRAAGGSLVDLKHERQEGWHVTAWSTV